MKIYGEVKIESDRDMGRTNEIEMKAHHAETQQENPLSPQRSPKESRKTTKQVKCTTQDLRLQNRFDPIQSMCDV